MEYEKLFETLGIKVEKLDPNYSPDDYGRKLMQNTFKQNDVSYSTYTLENNTNKYKITRNMY